MDDFFTSAPSSAPVNSMGADDDIFGGSSGDFVAAPSSDGSDPFGLDAPSSKPTDFAISSGGPPLPPMVQSSAPSSVTPMGSVSGMRTGPIPLAELDLPPFVRQFREEHAKVLAEKTEKAMQIKLEKEAKAKKELENFYADLTKRHEINLAQKREIDEQQRQQVELIGTGEASWSSVVSLADVDSKAVKHEKDIARLRSLMFSLKGSAISPAHAAA
mmetsp:Transcript_9310/g.16023  ORF Transcript_9310/g.16023 Transcript_9310/m.16023 type:complete len:216 (+) Transcript_9310:62-709(+)